MLFEGGLAGKNQGAVAEHHREKLFKGCEIVGQVQDTSMSNHIGATGGGATSSGSNDCPIDEVEGLLCKIQLRSPDVEWEVIRPSSLP